jgi:hypothetical protein
VVPVGASLFQPNDEPFTPDKRPIYGRFWSINTIRMKFDRAISVDFYLFGVC